MVRKLLLVGVMVAFLSAATQAFAADVFVTKNGAKYHKEVCLLLKNKGELTKLEKNEALKQGYEPCKRCFKEDVVVEEKDQ
jgi:methylphosphotriester-DNA--protein-cysteine methyltransferase